MVEETDEETRRLRDSAWEFMLTPSVWSIAAGSQPSACVCASAVATIAFGARIADRTGAGPVPGLAHPTALLPAGREQRRPGGVSGAVRLSSPSPVGMDRLRAPGYLAAAVRGVLGERGAGLLLNARPWPLLLAHIQKMTEGG
ncbi:hypothetical protein ACFCYH_16755 [Streptomyces sp. NPDC056400]|uniref:hypothetical protein n=1 Tax=Streptomyces sp. NPDC056400 TaxID=3345808 RepID=UPI0035D712FA